MTIVLVTEPGTPGTSDTAVAPVGDNVGLAVVTRGPVGLKLTAAMGVPEFKLVNNTVSDCNINNDI